MGAHQSRPPTTHDIDKEVTFDDFQILRAIGKGSFGKVCIVEKRDTGQLYAMKYMNKSQCYEKDALSNVLREVDILSGLEHPFLVNLWFSFQDEEDLFMVSDLFMGGDLRFHLQQGQLFDEQSIRLYILELGSALDYLQKLRIIHRDVKPDNILFDEKGHVHLTDFNIATVLADGQLATSMSGTKPYMAPEIFLCAMDFVRGYDWAVDWWSLGICAYEMLARIRPFNIHSTTPLEDVVKAHKNSPPYPQEWGRKLIKLLVKLLERDPSGRVTSLKGLIDIGSPFKEFRVEDVLEKKVQPSFAPPKDHLNCDPSLELEEMIVETKPLHKKKKRLAKQKSLQPTFSAEFEKVQGTLNSFKVFNREQEIRKRELELKEQQWEQELLEAMELCGKISEKASSSSAEIRYKRISSSPSMAIPTNSNSIIENLQLNRIPTDATIINRSSEIVAEENEVEDYEEELEETLQDILNSSPNLTLEDVEDLIEMHQFQEIERKIKSLLQDKKERMQRRYTRRFSNGNNAKSYLHEMVMERIAKDQEENAQGHENLIAQLKKLESSIN